MKKYAILLAVLFMVFSCKNDKKDHKPSDEAAVFKTKTVALDSTNLKFCETGDCPKLKVDYLKIEGDSDFSEAIDKKNKEDLIGIFNTSEDKPTATTVEGAVNEFVSDYQTYRNDYPEAESGYEASISQEIKSQNDKTIVLKTTFYLFTGGAHGYGGVHFLNFNAHSGKFLTHKDLISDIPAFRDFVEKKFRLKYNIPPDADINSKGFFFEDGKFALPKNIAVTPKEVVLLYNQYEAASYAQGQLRFVFPKKQVEQWFTY